MGFGGPQGEGIGGDGSEITNGGLIVVDGTPINFSKGDGTLGMDGWLGGIDSALTLGMGTGDVHGPVSATDNAIVRYDLTTGKIVQNSLAILADDGTITLPVGIRISDSALLGGFAAANFGTAANVATALSGVTSAMALANAHHARHENGGADQISLAGLAGAAIGVSMSPPTNFTPAAATVLGMMQGIDTALGVRALTSSPPAAYTLATILANGRVPASANDSLGSATLDFALFARSITPKSDQDLTIALASGKAVKIGIAGVGYSLRSIADALEIRNYTNSLYGYLNGLSYELYNASNTYKGIHHAAYGVGLASDLNVSWSAGTTFTTTFDLALARLAAASLRQGLAPSASPVAQTFTLGESSRPGTDPNVGGASGTIRPGLGTGTGVAPVVGIDGVVLTGSGSGVQSYVRSLDVLPSGVLKLYATASTGARIRTPSVGLVDILDFAGIFPAELRTGPIYISGTGTYEWNLHRPAANVAAFTPTAWLAGDAGRKRLATTVTSATGTLGNLTEHTVTLIAGRKYRFTATYRVANSLAADGVKFDLDGGAATMTSFWARYRAEDTTLLASTTVTAIATDFAVATITGEGVVTIEGGFVCNAGGTFIPRASGNTAVSGTASIYLDSTLIVQDII